MSGLAPAGQAALAVLLSVGQASAEGEGAVSWLQERIGIETEVQVVGTWAVPGGKLYASDPLVLAQTGPEAALITVPETPAEVVGLNDPDSGRTALFALVWSDAPVVCGDDLTSIAVDSGLAGFLTPADAANLERYAILYGSTYDGPYALQVDRIDRGSPMIFDQPGLPNFPISGTGAGDGVYPVVALRNADGKIVALYAQFLGDGDWVLPPPCPQDG